MVVSSLKNSLKICLSNEITYFFGFIFFLLSNFFWRTNPPFFFEEACICVSLVEDCTLLLFCLAIVAETSIHLASAFPKTHLWRRSLTLRSNIGAKATPKDVFLDYLLVFFLFKGLKNTLVTNSEPSLASIKFDFLRTTWEGFQKSLVWFERFYFSGYRLAKFWEIIKCYHKISIPSTIFRALIF